ncbi:MAG TPA: hypothetical protein VF074_00835, partial [Pyrinomonadaceae bacterium]
MRILSSTILLFSFAVCVTAQTPSNKTTPPDLTVLEKKWGIDVRNPALEKDPVEAMQDRDLQERQRIAQQRTDQILSDRGMPAQTSTVPASRETTRTGITVLYVYEVKLRNTGAQGIRKVTWEYVFFEPGTETELGRRRFISKVNLSPGGTTNVVVRAAVSPTGTVDARKAG